jgi:small subunit ribosomal protein S30e
MLSRRSISQIPLCHLDRGEAEAGEAGAGDRDKGIETRRRGVVDTLHVVIRIALDGTNFLMHVSPPSPRWQQLVQRGNRPTCRSHVFGHGNNCTVAATILCSSSFAVNTRDGKRSVLCGLTSPVLVGLTRFRFSSVHGSLAHTGKVRSQTPKVGRQEKRKRPRGRAKKRLLYNRRWVASPTLSASVSLLNDWPFFFFSQIRQRHDIARWKTSNVRRPFFRLVHILLSFTIAFDEMKDSSIVHTEHILLIHQITSFAPS